MIKYSTKTKSDETLKRDERAVNYLAMVPNTQGLFPQSRESGDVGGCRDLRSTSSLDITVSMLILSRELEIIQTYKTILLTLKLTF